MSNTGVIIRRSPPGSIWVCKNQVTWECWQLPAGHPDEFKDGRTLFDCGEHNVGDECLSCGAQKPLVCKTCGHECGEDCTNCGGMTAGESICSICSRGQS